VVGLDIPQSTLQILDPLLVEMAGKCDSFRFEIRGSTKSVQQRSSWVFGARFSIDSLLGKRAGSSRILDFLGTWDMFFFWPSDDMCSTPVAGNGCVPSQLPQSCNGRCGK